MLHSLLLSNDQDTVRVVSRVFKDLEVDMDHCGETFTALSQAIEHHYDAIIIDDAMDEPHLALQKLMELPSCSTSVRIVLADPAAALHPVFRASTQVVLYKPLSPDRVRHGLRAVRNLMTRERRRGNSRISTTLAARMSPAHARGTGKQITITDLSETGAAIRCDLDQLPASGGVTLDFSLPSESEIIHTTGELVWQDNKERAGIRFLDMPSHARKQLARWIKEHPTKAGHSIAARAGK
ncbi:MAG TPA: PilZ domain-containing protein [Terriglobales bacterium]|jgi:DNA-binding NarL/FixJ family response regulator|nr:PilZ domain-containing protein [Terriglobales bacterium]